MPLLVWANNDEELSKLDHLTVIRFNSYDCARYTSLDVVHQFHDFDDPDGIFCVYLLADGHELGGPG